MAVRNAIVAGLACAAALIVTTAPSAAGAPAAAEQVVLRDIAFGPSAARVRVGRRVT